MTRCFERDTRLVGWERMMMDPRRTHPQKMPTDSQVAGSAASGQRTREGGV